MLGTGLCGKAYRSGQKETAFQDIGKSNIITTGRHADEVKSGASFSGLEFHVFTLTVSPTPKFIFSFVGSRSWGWLTAQLGKLSSDNILRSITGASNELEVLGLDNFLKFQGVCSSVATTVFCIALSQY